jgi:hypothetical protein
MKSLNLCTKTVPHKSNKRTRKVLRNLRARHKLDTNFKPFLAANTLDTINAAKSSSATGPDGLAAIHLKHLGPKCFEYLT